MVTALAPAPITTLQTVDRRYIVNRQGRDFILYAGLLDLAHHRGLQGIKTTLLQAPTEANGQVAIVAAEVTFAHGTFSGIGDASPSNVSRAIAPHSIRMAETRAKARGMRDGLNVDGVSLEELGPEGRE